MTTTRTQRPTPCHRSRAFSRAPNRPAFTLIEIALVLGIVAVIAAIAMPRISGSMSRQRCLSAAKRVAADIEYARSAAIANSAARKIIFSPARGGYVVPNAPDPLNLSNATQYFVRITDAPYQAKLAAVSFGDDTGRAFGSLFDTAEVSEVNFDGFGTPDTTGWVTVRCGDVLYKVTVDASGRTSVSQVTQATVTADISSAPKSVVADALEKH